jgi:hypothetical protein
MKSLRSLLAAGVVAGGPSAASAGEAPVLQRVRAAADLTGAVRVDYFRSSKQLDGEKDFLAATAQLKALPTFRPTLDGKLELRLLSPPLDKGGDLDLRVLEGYLTWHSPRIAVRLGRQIVAWGRADGINPTDNLTARDYVVLLPFEDDQRFGTTALKVDAFVTPDHTLTFFASPFFEPHRIPTPASVVRMLPARSVRKTALGVRFNKVGETLDWSVSAYRGFNLLPTLRLDRAGGPIRARHERIQVYGADFARNFGRFGVRGELAYVDTGKRSVLRSNVYLVVGVDRTFLANLNVNVQYFRRQVRGFEETWTTGDPAERTVARQSAVLNAQQVRVADGITFRVGNKWLHDTLEVEIFGIVNLRAKDSFARPQLSYVVSDHWKVSIGYDWLRGAAGTQFGGQKSNRGGFAETRFSF